MREFLFAIDDNLVRIGQAGDFDGPWIAFVSALNPVDCKHWRHSESATPSLSGQFLMNEPQSIKFFANCDAAPKTRPRIDSTAGVWRRARQICGR
jgi:hypothetical protein